MVESPNLHDRPAALVQVTRVVDDSFDPRVSSNRSSASRRCARSASPAMSYEIAHVAPGLAGRRADMLRAFAQSRRVSSLLRPAGQADDEMLQPGAVDAVVAHPLEMPQHGCRIVGTEQLRRSAVRMAEARRGETFGGGISTHVGPHLERQRLGRDALAGRGSSEPNRGRLRRRGSETSLDNRTSLCGAWSWHPRTRAAARRPARRPAARVPGPGRRSRRRTCVVLLWSCGD